VQLGATNRGSAPRPSDFGLRACFGIRHSSFGFQPRKLSGLSPPLDPQHRNNPCKHWVFLRSGPATFRGKPLYNALSGLCRRANGDDATRFPGQSRTSSSQTSRSVRSAPGLPALSHPWPLKIHFLYLDSPCRAILLTPVTAAPGVHVAGRKAKATTNCVTGVNRIALSV
jgi:hypothetical protein